MQLLNTLLLLSVLIGLCCGHGFLARPASRNNMRLVVDAKMPTECAYGAGQCTMPEVDYDKQSGAAGGPGVVHASCPFGSTDCLPQHGMCGDKFDGVQNHLEGGKFSSGLVNGIYAPGQTIQMDLIVTAHHNGYHEFILWDVSDDATAKTVTTPATRSYRLKQYNPSSTHTKCEYWNIDPAYNWCMPPPTGPSINVHGYNYTVAFTLPADVTCKRCVLQWHWVTGNSPGANPEEFWNCADISIRSSGPYINNQLNAAQLTVDGGNAPGQDAPVGAVQATIPPVPSGASCIAVAGRGIDDAWCKAVNCQAEYVLGGFCQYTLRATAAPTTTTSPVTSSDCVAVPGQGVTDAFCRSVGCNAAYVGTCVIGSSSTATSAPATSAPATSAPATSRPATSAPATSAPATAAPATSRPATSAPATSAPATSAPATSRPATSAPATSRPATSAPATSAPATSRPATSAPATSRPATSSPATSAPATSAPATSRPATSAPATSSPATSRPATASPATSSPATSRPATSSPANKPPPVEATSKPVATSQPSSAPSTTTPTTTPTIRPPPTEATTKPISGTAQPSSAPATTTPTTEPTSASQPSSAPATATPTTQPDSTQPSSAPATSTPTTQPISTSQPSSAPVTAAPTTPSGTVQATVAPNDFAALKTSDGVRNVLSVGMLFVCMAAAMLL